MKPFGRWHRFMMPGLMALAIAAAAARAETEAIEPSLDRAAFSRFVGLLPLDRDQQLIAELLYRDYAGAMDDLGRRTGERLDAAGRQRIEDAFSGRVIVGAVELRGLRVAVLEASRTSGREADELLVRLLEDVRALLPDGSVPNYELALVDLRRVVYLDPRLARASDESYAGDGVDVVLLAADGSMAGGELEGVDRPAITGILATYRRSLAALLTATAAADREGRLDLAIARIEKDRERQRREEQAALERWRLLHELNRRAVAEIAAVLRAEAGASAERRWIDRFDRSCFPRLFGPARPTLEHDWIRRQPLDVKMWQEAGRIHDAYLLEHARLCREAMTLLLRGRIEHMTRFHARMDPTVLADGASRALYEDLLKSSGRRAKLETETSEALGRLLDVRQRQQMSADLAAAAFGRRR